MPVRPLPSRLRLPQAGLACGCFLLLAHAAPCLAKDNPKDQPPAALPELAFRRADAPALPGRWLGYAPETGVRWGTDPAAKRNVAAGDLAEVRLGEPSAKAPADFTPDVAVALPGGGFTGKLVSLTQGKLTVDTWFAGRLTLDAREVVGLHPLDKEDLGRKDPWYLAGRGIVAEGKWSVEEKPVQPGPEAGRMRLEPWRAAECATVLFPQGVTREFVLKGDVVVRFDAPSPDRKRSAVLTLNFHDGQFHGQWMAMEKFPNGKARGAGQSIQASARYDPSAPLRIRLQPDSAPGQGMRIHLDGRYVGFIPMERCPDWAGKLSLVSKHGAEVSDASLVSWRRHPATAAPRILFANGDLIEAAPEAIADGKVRLKVDGQAMEVPFARFRWVGLPASGQAPASADARLVMADAELPLRLTASGADIVAGTLAGAGEVRVPAGSVWKIVFPAAGGAKEAEKK